jgi:hypothetical protein
MRSSELNNICAQEKQQHIHEFADYCCEKLGIDRPDLTLKGTNDTNALGYTDMSDGSVTIVVADRHQMDIMRTLAHELVHCKQMTTHTPCGDTGSKDENEANALAGILMREWGQQNPDLFTEGDDMEEAKTKLSAQDRFNKRLKDKHGIDLDAKEKFYADMKKKFQQSLDSKQNTKEGQKCWPGYEKKGTKKMFGKTVNNCVKKESTETELEESKTARMMALITALGATYGLEDEARAFADQIKQNIHNAQNAEPNPGMPDPVSPDNMMPGSDRVMRPPVDEKAPPGREKQVKKLKKKFDDPGAPYAIAWAQHNKHGKPTREQRLKEIKKRQMMIRQKIQEIAEAKKDACYHKVRSRYKVWPSAYASGALVQCRKKGAANWGNKSKK